MNKTVLITLLMAVLSTPVVAKESTDGAWDKTKTGLKEAWGGVKDGSKKAWKDSAETRKEIKTESKGAWQSIKDVFK